MAEESKNKKEKYSRREFVVSSGAIIAGGALSAALPEQLSAEKKGGKEEYPLSKGYLVYDSRQCSGCMSCMLACSLVHDGEASTSRSRIQIDRNVFNPYPQDIQIFVCRQCPEPMCVKNCPTGACHISSENGNVRMIDSEKCIGCKACINACPYIPHRPVFNVSENISIKCDLCANAPYFSKKGGPFGEQACVTTCPAGALKVVSELPSQKDSIGYDLNLKQQSNP